MEILHVVIDPGAEVVKLFVEILMLQVLVERVAKPSDRSDSLNHLFFIFGKLGDFKLGLFLVLGVLDGLTILFREEPIFLVNHHFIMMK